MISGTTTTGGASSIGAAIATIAGASPNSDDAAADGAGFAAVLAGVSEASEGTTTSPASSTSGGPTGAEGAAGDPAVDDDLGRPDHAVLLSAAMAALQALATPVATTPTSVAGEAAANLDAAGATGGTGATVDAAGAPSGATGSAGPTGSLPNGGAAALALAEPAPGVAVADATQAGESTGTPTGTPTVGPTVGLGANSETSSSIGTPTGTPGDITTTDDVAAPEGVTTRTTSAEPTITDAAGAGSATERRSGRAPGDDPSSPNAPAADTSTEGQPTVVPADRALPGRDGDGEGASHDGADPRRAFQANARLDQGAGTHAANRGPQSGTPGVEYTAEGSAPWAPATAHQPSERTLASLRLPQLSVDLGDEGLGPLRLQAQSSAGGLHLTLTAGDRDTAALLANASSGLRRELEQSGTAVRTLDVAHGDARGDARQGARRESDSRDTDERRIDGVRRSARPNGAIATSPDHLGASTNDAPGGPTTDDASDSLDVLI